VVIGILGVAVGHSGENVTVGEREPRLGDRVHGLVELGRPGDDTIADRRGGLGQKIIEAASDETTMRAHLQIGKAAVFLLGPTASQDSADMGVVGRLVLGEPNVSLHPEHRVLTAFERKRATGKALADGRQQFGKRELNVYPNRVAVRIEARLRVVGGEPAKQSKAASLIIASVFPYFGSRCYSASTASGGAISVAISAGSLSPKVCP